MRSFEQPLSWWQSLAERLQEPLQELERLRAGAHSVEGEIQAAVERIVASGILPSEIQSQVGPPGSWAPYSSVEALSFYQRQHVDQEALCHRRAVEHIHANHATMEWKLEAIVELHRMMLAPREAHAGVWKSVRFEHGPPQFTADGRLIGYGNFVQPEEVQPYMERLFALFDQRWQEGVVPKPLLIAGFALDYLKIHPFLDGNGRSVRLAILWLFYRCDHAPFRYASLETLFSRRRIHFLQSLYASERGWLERTHDLYQWANFLLDIGKQAYHQTAENVLRLTTTAARIARAADALAAMPARFQRGDLLRQDSDVEPAWANLLLARHYEQGRLQAIEDERGVTFVKAS